jgi:hypothetical protein
MTSAYSEKAVVLRFLARVSGYSGCDKFGQIRSSSAGCSQRSMGV